MSRLTFGQAIMFAAMAHIDQEYSDGEPYVLHAIRVAMRVKPEWRVIAVLHDTLEDYGKLPEELTDLELQVIQALTRDKDSESYEEYIERLLMMDGDAGHVARSIKLADLSDNLENIEARPRLAKRYKKAYDVLVGLPAEVPSAAVLHPDDYDEFIGIVEGPRPTITMRTGQGEEKEVDIEVSTFCPRGRIIWKDENGKAIGHQPLRFEEKKPT